MEGEPMYLCRIPDVTGIAQIYPLDPLEVIYANGIEPTVIARRPRAWRYRRYAGSGWAAIGRTAEAARIAAESGYVIDRGEAA